MAFFQMNYHSDVLKMGVSVNVVIPEKAKTLIGMKADGEGSYKTIYLLHGLSDDHTIWMRRTSIERYAAERGIAVVMPSVARSWYTDTAYDANYFTFVADELPRVCRGFFKGMSDRREDNLIGGLSMGGYGAIKVALRRPDAFGGVLMLSSAVDIVHRITPTPKVTMEEWQGVFGFDVEDGTKALVGGPEDPFALARQNHEKGIAFPNIYMWCGTEDGLIKANDRFSALLTELGVDHLYESSEGNHSWKWWDIHVQSGLDYLLAK